MSTDKNEKKEECRIESKHTGLETHSSGSRAMGDDQPQKVYLVNSKHLRVSSTKNWARIIDQLRKQIRNSSKINGGLQDHCF
jgi:hypothetical protein